MQSCAALQMRNTEQSTMWLQPRFAKNRLARSRECVQLLQKPIEGQLDARGMSSSRHAGRRHETMQTLINDLLA